MINNLKRVSKSNVTLTILKQHIHIVSINEEIKSLRQDKKDLEAELLNKNKEIYEVWFNCFLIKSKISKS